MKHLIQPTRWSCLPTSFAMVLEVNVSSIFDFLGHDGSDIIWPNLPEPLRRRCFHIQEMIRFAYYYGYSVTPFDHSPMLGVSENESYIDVVLDPIEYQKILEKERGVFTGLAESRNRHAVAWNKREIFDPNGTVYGLEKFSIETFWAMILK